MMEESLREKIPPLTSCGGFRAIDESGGIEISEQEIRWTIILQSVFVTNSLVALFSKEPTGSTAFRLFLVSDLTSKIIWFEGEFVKCGQSCNVPGVELQEQVRERFPSTFCHSST
jgi:hypothetical protein